MISITPQGVGVVEAMVVVAFTAYEQNAAAATATALVYRGIVFWMPFIIGAILMTQIKAFKDSSKKGVEEAAERQEKIDEKIAYDFKDTIDEMRDEQIQKKYLQHQSNDDQEIHLNQ